MRKSNVSFIVVIVFFLFSLCVSGPVFSKSIEDTYQEALLEQQWGNYGNFDEPDTALFRFRNLFENQNCTDDLKAQCALRITEILKDSGRNEDALVWADKAKAAAENNPDFSLEAYNLKGLVYFKNMKKFENALNEFSSGLAIAQTVSDPQKIITRLRIARCKSLLLQKTECVRDAIDTVKTYRLKLTPEESPEIIELLEITLSRSIEKVEDKPRLLKEAGWADFQIYLETLQSRTIEEDILLAFVRMQTIVLLEPPGDARRNAINVNILHGLDVQKKIRETGYDNHRFPPFDVNNMIEKYARYLYDADVSVHVFDDTTSLPQPSDREKAFNTFIILKAILEAKGEDGLFEYISYEENTPLINMLLYYDTPIKSREGFKVMKAAADRIPDNPAVSKMTKHDAALLYTKAAYFLAYNETGPEIAVELLASVKDDPKLKEDDDQIADTAKHMYEGLTVVKSMDAFQYTFEWFKRGLVFYGPGPVIDMLLCPIYIEASNQPFYKEYFADENMPYMKKKIYTFYLGIAHYHIRDYTQAQQVFRDVIALSESAKDHRVLSVFYMWLSSTYQRQGDKEEALKVLEEGEKVGFNLRLLVSKAHLLKSMNRPDEADDIWRLILEKAPNSPYAKTAKYALGLED